MVLFRQKLVPWLIVLGVTSLITGCSPELEPGNNNQHAVSTNENSTVIVPEPVSENKNSNTSPYPLSLQALSQKEFNGSELKLGKVLAETSTYTRHYITYKSGELTISGILNVPKGVGPFPALILNHGHIDTAIYTNGRGLKREQDYFARNGYIVLHPDYRNHADSGKDTRDELAVRLSYIEDSVNAVYALKRSGLPSLDAENIGMLGHSMGGGVTLGALVVQPELVKAAVLYAPVTGNMRNSYERWMSRRPETAEKISKLYGDPDQSPDFWDGISSEKMFGSIQAPIHIFHGTADDSVPLEWSQRTEQLLKDAGRQVTFTIYENAPHEFSRDWSNFMESSKDFFDGYLKKN